MSTPNRPYQPIDCSLHDRLESAATRRMPVRIMYRVMEGEWVETEDRIVDIFTRDGVEYVKLERSTEIRLDDLGSVDGVPFHNEAC